MSKSIRWGIAAVSLTVAAACGGSDTTAPGSAPPPPPPPASVASVVISPDSSAVAIGRTRELFATAKDAAGNALTGRTVTWNSSAQDVATVSGTGVVTGVAVGRVLVTATVEGKIAQAIVNVQSVPVANVSITPDSATVMLGAVSQLVVQTKDDLGVDLPGRAVRWSSSAPGIVAVDSLTGRITALASGSALITAISEGKSHTARIVVHAPVATVSVTTALDTLEAYDWLQMNAVLRDANQQVLTGRVVRWTSSNPAVAQVDSMTGVLTGYDRGTVTVTASSEGKSGSASRVVVIKYRSLVAGTQHSCDIASGGFVWCWGQNGNEGRIGLPQLGADVISTTPVHVPTTGWNGVRAKRLAAFGRHTCAIDTNALVWCWGSNNWGALGAGGISESAKPVRVSATLQFKDIAVGPEHSCGITTVGAMYCWGHNDWRQFAMNTPAMSEAPVAVAPDLRFASLSTGATFTCGVTVAGQAYCWGYDGWGNLGDGRPISFGNTFSATPVLVAGGRAWSQVGAGQIHSCGLTNGGDVFCWGNNGGKLGNGAVTESSTPVPVAGLTGVQQLAVGANHNCAVTVARDVWCWGLNGNGQTGQPASVAEVRPMRLGGLTASEVAAAGIGTGSGAHSCAVSADRLTVKCWGRNDTGQLGNGTTSAGTMANIIPTIVTGQRPLP